MNSKASFFQLLNPLYLIDSTETSDNVLKRFEISCREQIVQKGINGQNYSYTFLHVRYFVGWNDALVIWRFQKSLVK